MGSESFDEFRKRVGTAGQGKTFAPDVLAPAGNHLATVAVALARQTQAGDWRLRVKFEVDCGPHTGTSSWWGKNYEPSSEDSLKWFFAFTEIMGVDWDAEDMPKDPTDAEGIVNAVAAQLAGKRAQIKCAEGREFKGRKDVEVKFVNAVPAGSPEPMEKPKAATVKPNPAGAAGMAKVAGAAKKSGPPAPPKPTGAPRDSL